MAKSKSDLNLQGRFGEITFVNSPTYGDHIRANRGTHKKAEVNEAFKNESKNLLRANEAARIFKNAIDPYRRDIWDGQLWQRLVSIFRKQLKDLGEFNFGKLEQFEIDLKHKFEGLLKVRPVTAFDKEKSVLHVDISYDSHPKFIKAKNTNEYRLTAIAIFPDLIQKTASTASTFSDVIKLTGQITPLQFQLNVPEHVTSFVVCLKIEGCTDGVPNGFITTMGLRVITSGILV